LENKRPRKPSACVRRHGSPYTTRVSETYEKQVFYIKDWGLEWIPHHLGTLPNTHFSTIQSLTWYISKIHRKL